MKQVLVLGMILGFGMLASCGKSKSAESSAGEDTVAVKDSDLAFVGNSPVRLNEVAYQNIDWNDHEGKDPSWVEFYNPADTAVDLAGFALTDTQKQPRRWVLPSLVVPAKGYQVVFFSGKDIRTALPASDSVNLITGDGWTWCDGDRPSSEGPAGHSKIEPYEYPDIFSVVDGKPVISVAMTLGNNADLPEEFTWGAAQTFMNFKLKQGTKSINLGNANTLVLKGYLESGRDLTVRLAQVGTQAWLGWAATISGTGLKDGEYRIALPQGSSMPDLAHLYGIQFESPKNYASTVHFTIRDIYAYKAPVLLHAGFKLEKKEATLLLTDSNSAIRDSLHYVETPPGMSYGYDSLGALGVLSKPSPLGTSRVAASGKAVKRPEMVQKEGFYPGPIQVMVKVPEGSIVRYTVDGSVPTDQSSLVQGPIAINATTVLRTVAFQNGNMPSEVSTHTYFIGESFSLPVVSIATDSGYLFHPDTGIYMPGPNPGKRMPQWGANFWMPKEVPISIELFENNGARGFQQDAGLTIFGNYSRMNDKKSVSVNFREKYGKTHLDYALFPAHPQFTRFKKFGLRSNGGNAKADYIRDALAQNLTEGLGVDYQYNRPVVVFYDGKYFGIHRLLQKADEDYPETMFGLNADNIDLVEAYGGPVSGSRAGYDDLMAFLAKADMQNSENVARLERELDVNEFMNYWSAQIYFNNTDWPGNNIRIWRSSNPLTKWRYLLFDVDFSFGSDNGGEPDDFDMMTFTTNTEGPDYPNGAKSTLLFRKLLENSNYQTMFINRMSLLLGSYFAPARVQRMIDSMQSEVLLERTRDLTRWKLSETDWVEGQKEIDAFARVRPAHVREHVRRFFQLGADVTCTLQAQGEGVLKVHDLAIPAASYTGAWFAGKTIHLSAMARNGHTFTGWSDGVATAERDWVPVEGATLVANFR